MKKLIYSFILILLSFNFANSQNCDNLLISEIVFGDIPLIGKDVKFNHSVEIYNPTENIINLNNYFIELIDTEGENLQLRLEGTINPSKTFVISNSFATTEILELSNQTDTNFYLGDKIYLALKYGNQKIDEIGSKNLLNNENLPIDLEEALNNPEYLDNYLETQNLTLKSIKFLTLRRMGIVKKGNTSFDNADLLKEWGILPYVEISDLGEHFSACHNVMILWKDIDQFKPEAQIFESNGAPDNDPENPQISASGTVMITQELDEPLDFTIFANLHEYMPSDDPASSSDWKSIDLLPDYTIPAGATEYPFPKLTWPIIDIFPENEEGYGLRVNAAYNGSAIADPFNDVFDVKILPDFTSVEDKHDYKKDVTIYPTIASDFIYFKIEENDELHVTGINIFSINGQILFRKYYDDISHTKTDKISLQTSIPNGYNIILINTNKGLVSKKFYKF